MADGGTVKKKKPMKPHVPPRIKDPIPKSKHKLKRVKKPKGMADGGKISSKKRPKKLKPEALGSGMAQKAGSAIKNRQSALDKKIADAGG